MSGEVVASRAYASLSTRKLLESKGFRKTMLDGLGSYDALYIPLWSVYRDGAGRQEQRGCQVRPDYPRQSADGKAVKYENPSKQKTILDVPPSAFDRVKDGKQPLWITEGPIKADAGAAAGLAIVALTGVWMWKDKDGPLPDWEEIPLKGRLVYIAFDSDIVTKRPVHEAMARLGVFLEARGAEVAYVYLRSGEHGEKVGLDDFLAAGGTASELEALATPTLRDFTPGADLEPEPPYEPPPPATLSQVLDAWQEMMELGEPPDVQPMLFMVAVAAAALSGMSGDPLWGVIVGGSGWGKTEALMPLDGLPDVAMASQVTEAGLMSGSSDKDRTLSSTGGLLPSMGDRGLLVFKEMTSLLQGDRHARAKVFAAFREIADGKWVRH